eukprot:scaffold132_cov170-Amphora_coffeaeformis.AAC.57
MWEYRVYGIVLVWYGSSDFDTKVSIQLEIWRFLTHLSRSSLITVDGREGVFWLLKRTEAHNAQPFDAIPIVQTLCNVSTMFSIGSNSSNNRKRAADTIDSPGRCCSRPRLTLFGVLHRSRAPSSLPTIGENDLLIPSLPDAGLRLQSYKQEVSTTNAHYYLGANPNHSLAPPSELSDAQLHAQIRALQAEAAKRVLATHIASSKATSVTSK